MRPRKSFLLRINPDLYGALEAWAQQEFRSVNGQIEYVLKEAVRKQGRRTGPDDESPAPAGEPAPPRPQRGEAPS